jgi:hypothetical protein
MKICPKCGKLATTPDEEFCIDDGTRLVEKLTESEEYAPKNKVLENQKKEEQARRIDPNHRFPPKVTVIISAIFAIVLGVFSIGIIFSGLFPQFLIKDETSIIKNGGSIIDIINVLRGVSFDKFVTRFSLVSVILLAIYVLSGVFSLIGGVMTLVDQSKVKFIKIALPIQVFLTVFLSLVLGLGGFALNFALALTIVFIIFILITRVIDQKRALGVVFTAIAFAALIIGSLNGISVQAYRYIGESNTYSGLVGLTYMSILSADGSVYVPVIITYCLNILAIYVTCAFVYIKRYGFPFAAVGAFASAIVSMILIILGTPLSGAVISTSTHITSLVMMIIAGTFLLVTGFTKGKEEKKDE